MEQDIKARLSRLEYILSQFVTSIATPDPFIPNPALKVMENRANRACNLLSQCDAVLTHVITSKHVQSAERGCLKTLYSNIHSLLHECGWKYPVTKGDKNVKHQQTDGSGRNRQGSTVAGEQQQGLQDGSTSSEQEEEGQTKHAKGVKESKSVTCGVCKTVNNLADPYFNRHGFLMCISCKATIPSWAKEEDKESVKEVIHINCMCGAHNKIYKTEYETSDAIYCYICHEQLPKLPVNKACAKCKTVLNILLMYSTTKDGFLCPTCYGGLVPETTKKCPCCEDECQDLVPIQAVTYPEGVCEACAVSFK